jgi:hypothetical protein
MGFFKKPVPKAREINAEQCFEKVTSDTLANLVRSIF